MGQLVGTSVNVLFLGHVNRALCGAKRVVASKTHQHLEEDDEELVAGHEVAVQNAQVEPAAQAPEHLDQHLLIVARLLHTRRLGG